jgi:hypothetical protein
MLMVFLHIACDKSDRALVFEISTLRIALDQKMQRCERYYVAAEGNVGKWIALEYQEINPLQSITFQGSLV